MTLRTATLTLLALVAFAANSLLCRLALAHNSIDPASFTAIRIMSGAVALALIVVLPGWKRATKPIGDWISGAMLALYAVAFSYAYTSLTAGTGALILFACVQTTMIGHGLFKGERLRSLQWLGLAAAMGGLLYLVMPGLKAPSPIGAALMAIAGIAWGVYSLRGRGVTEPGLATAGNFVYAAPIACAVMIFARQWQHVSPYGVLLAVISGAITSGIGYVIWYAALPGLTSTRAAVVQLSVPVIAAVGGVLMLNEEPSVRLATASILTLGGVALVVLSQTKQKTKD